MQNLKNCDNCKSTIPAIDRAAMACGFEAPTGPPWRHRGFIAEAKTCPGYLANLPEVVEVARARVHWKNGSLRDFVGGPPSENLMYAVEVLDAEASECERFMIADKN